MEEKSSSLIKISNEQYDFAMKYITDPIYRDKMIYPCTSCEKLRECKFVEGKGIDCSIMEDYRKDVEEAREMGVYELVNDLRAYADLCGKKFEIEDQMELQAKKIDESYDIENDNRG